MGLSKVYLLVLLERVCAGKVWETAGIVSICVSFTVFSFAMAYNNKKVRNIWMSCYFLCQDMTFPISINTGNMLLKFPISINSWIRNNTIHRNCKKRYIHYMIIPWNRGLFSYLLFEFTYKNYSNWNWLETHFSSFICILFSVFNVIVHWHSALR